MRRGFSADPRTRWIAAPSEHDRPMELLDHFSFYDETRIWTAPRGLVIDGAPIPRPLWALVGSPYTGLYRRASIVHAWGSSEALAGRVDRREVDRMFYRACRASECSRVQSIMLFAALRIGAWYGHTTLGGDEPLGPRLMLDPRERLVIEAYQQLAGSSEVLDTADDAAVVELALDRAQARHLTRLAAVEQTRTVARAFG